MIDVGSILAVALPLIVIIGGIGVAWIALHGRQRLRELAIRERIALIEKGLVPSPESDPAGFESALSAPRISDRALRYRTAGLVLTGGGLALTFLLLFVMPHAVRAIGLGVGGAIAILGLTLFGNGLLLAGDDGQGNGRSTGMRG